MTTNLPGREAPPPTPPHCGGEGSHIPGSPSPSQWGGGQGVGLSRTAVIAVGGNALILDGQRGTIAEQFENARDTARHVAALVKATTDAGYPSTVAPADKK